MTKRMKEVTDCDFCDAKEIEPFTKFEFSSGSDMKHVTACVTFTGFDYRADETDPDITYDICPQCAFKAMKAAYGAMEDRL